MDRVNAQGIPRRQLKWTLTQRRHVNKARSEDACLLCRADGVDESGLCNTCYSLLDEDELKIAERWLGGIGP